VAVDLELAHAAIAAAEAAKTRLAGECHALTNGEVDSATRRDKLLAHLLLEYGIDLPDLQASTLERRVQDPDLPETMRELLINRQQAAMGSTSKYKSIIKAVNDDGRARGLIQFDGASRTGRDSGRTVQPQNFVRPPKYLSKDWEFSVEAVKAGAASLFFDNVMEATAGLARAALIPGEGKKFVVADLSNIEGRMLAWLAGEEWKLQAFRDYDAGTGHDLYKLAYAKAFKINPEDVDEHMRQIGKVMELALGYGGGVGAFITFALAYNIDLEELAEIAFGTIPEWALREAEEFYHWTVKKKRNTFGLSPKAFLVCDALKRMWRAAHPNIVAFWGELEEACRNATQNPGKRFTARRCTAIRSGNWLRVLLPSGRSLCYPAPQVGDKGELSYMGNNQYTRKWQRIKTYSGKLAENVTQSVSAHILKDAKPGVEAAGYEIILPVHDELITEAPDTEEYDEDVLSELLAENPPWALDMPLAAAGFQGYRYRKG
jgi:DNA polymerase